MSFAYIRAKIETQVSSAFAALTPAVSVVFDNVQETPPELPYVICLISYGQTTTSVIHPVESMMEQINGNLQISCYAPRAQGMGPLEDLAAVATRVMVNMKSNSDSFTTVVCGAVNGPEPVLAGSEPYALVTLSCPFQARLDAAKGFKYYTNQVLLT